MYVPGDCNILLISASDLQCKTKKVSFGEMLLETFETRGAMRLSILQK